VEKPNASIIINTNTLTDIIVNLESKLISNDDWCILLSEFWKLIKGFSISPLLRPNQAIFH
tara:strand:- start:1952 stop:2134 length:183 start_codon:yes stop_codon:yes gene_type:complete